MLAFAYYALLSAPVLPPLSVVVQQLAIFLVAAVGIAGFGHVFTDMFDVDEDRVRQQSNLWDHRSTTSRAVLLGALVLAAVIPWYFLPTNRITIALLGAELLAFVLYAVPPIRLKVRGAPGIVADSMYAHVLPALWTWIPFALLSGAATPVVVGLTIAMWGMFFGARDLMIHQAIDAVVDRATGAMTYGARRGRDALIRTIQRRLLPAELFLFLLLLVEIAPVSPLPAVFFGIYFPLRYLMITRFWLGSLDATGGSVNGDRVIALCRRVMSPFYYLWLPLLLLIHLALRSPPFLLLLAVHLLLFGRMIARLSRSEIADIVAFCRHARRPAFAKQ